MRTIFWPVFVLTGPSNFKEWVENVVSEDWAASDVQKSVADFGYEIGWVFPKLMKVSEYGLYLILHIPQAKNIRIFMINNQTFF